jgi:phosphomevalonate kinase
MSKTWVARAPGKLFLLGEYAVLDACPAVVAAIDRHIEVRLKREGLRARVRISAPGCGTVELPAAAPPTIQGPLRFVISAFRAARSQCSEVGMGGISLTVTSTMAGPGSAKMGFGSSAAVTVATVAALLADVGRDVDRNNLFATAFTAHRAAQSGVGSGADVAASAYGGLILFQPRPHSLPLVTPLALPRQMQLLVAWSGESASTAGLVQQYLAARNGTAAARAAFVDASHACVDAFVRGLSDRPLSLAAIDANAVALERLASQLGLPVMTPRLARLLAIARAHGAAAKTSGAGGGDCGIALTGDAAAAARIRSAWRAAQLEPLDVGLDCAGVTVASC